MTLSAITAGRRLFGTYTVVAVVAVVVTVLSTGRASASCGDYLTVHNGEAVGSPADPPDTLAHRPASPRDCPDCSDRRPAPFTPPSSVGPTSDVKVCLASGASSDGFESGSRVVPTTCSRPVRRPVPVYHPPRG